MDIAFLIKACLKRKITLSGITFISLSFQEFCIFTKAEYVIFIQLLLKSF